ncbi:hypothetical protein BDZ89DRAFT_1066670 [Hymenopellis radicata]|nr:hypothetical protein BDZ89DRAFT_1066670 [Hymenopellis radicata]
MSARIKPSIAFAAVGSIVLSAGAVLAMQQDAKKKEGPASVYKQDAKPGQSDLSSDVNEVVEGKTSADFRHRSDYVQSARRRTASPRPFSFGL